MNPSVAIVGGGIAGLVCAARLHQLGVNNITVFDTGKNACGGRCSSRVVTIDGQLHVFDHSAQYFTVNDPQFANIVSFLHNKGAVKVWNGSVGHIHRNGKFERYDKSYQAFIGSEGMHSIAETLASLVTVKRPVWISDVFWETGSHKWKVDKFGYFDYLVIAHNGKCADRLMSTAGVPDIHRLLQVRFSDKVNPKDQRMQLCSLWVLMVAFPSPLKLPYEGAHVDDDIISWLGNNTKKLSGPGPGPKLGNSIECWTIFSTRKFGMQHKVPQENIPPKKAEEVKNIMLEAFARIARLNKENLRPVFSQVQLWGAAVPMNTWSSLEKSVYDSAHQVGICGDWLVSPSIQGAALSGMDLAARINQHISGNQSSTSLKQNFAVTNTAAIGDFPVKHGFIFKPSGTKQS